MSELFVLNIPNLVYLAGELVVLFTVGYLLERLYRKRKAARVAGHSPQGALTLFFHRLNLPPQELGTEDRSWRIYFLGGPPLGKIASTRSIRRRSKHI